MTSDDRIERAIEPFLASKSRGGSESGNYRRNLERCVTEFVDWMDSESAATFDELDTGTFRQYARQLAERDLASSTVQTYYANVSAFVGWCAREGLVEENYAQRHEATEALPSDTGRRRDRQQAWSADQRRALLRYATEQVETTLDDGDHRALLKVTRDRALVVLLAYSGVRGGELLRSPHDDRRTGVTWRDVSLADSSLTVLSKKQQWDDRALPEQTHHALRALRSVLDPPTDDWPVFPTIHRPTLYETARTTLREEGINERRIERRLSEESALDVLLDERVAPPSITTDGGRRIMQRLTDGAGIELDTADRHDYLAPHGGRRGAGEVMVRSKGVTAAARLLDNSERVVREAYSHIEAGEMAEIAGDAFEEIDD